MRKLTLRGVLATSSSRFYAAGTATKQSPAPARITTGIIRQRRGANGPVVPNDHLHPHLDPLVSEHPSAQPPISVSLPADLAEGAHAVIRDLASLLWEGHMGAKERENVDSLRRRIEQLVKPEDLETNRTCLLLSVICDLSLQGWRLEVGDGALRLWSPESAIDPAAEKQRVRAAHAIERDRQLAEPAARAFVAQMEEARLHNGQWVSVFSLMRDGRQLAATLARAGSDDEELRRAVDPYLQFISSADDRCAFTGLRLVDIWRYFRMTWASAHQSSPGRRMHVLVRDRAASGHPVIGIAALCSAVVQLSVRDEWIGWTPEETFARLENRVTRADAEYFLRVLDEAIDAVFVDDFLAEGLVRRGELVRPSPSTVRRLEGESRRARVAHEEDPISSASHAYYGDAAKGDWVEIAGSPLFRSKRAAALAELLQTRLALQAVGFVDVAVDGLRRALDSAEGRRALSRIIRVAKSQRVGIDMLDITTCGAIAPYNAILGGKLVSLLMMSPEVVAHYERRYGQAVSLIASGLAGRLVRRPPQLVLLGTTSLYGVASSQYNRLRIPANELPGAKGDMGFILLKKTEGFGSFHFSGLTRKLGEEVARLALGRRRVNYIFGEGVNPKMRSLREAMTLISLPADKVLRHGSPRLVYAVPLAINFREVLLGRAKTPKYFLRHKSPERGTRAIVDFWIRRWLQPRASRVEILDAVAGQTLERPVRHGARVNIAASLSDLPLFSG